MNFFGGLGDQLDTGINEFTGFLGGLGGSNPAAPYDNGSDAGVLSAPLAAVQPATGVNGNTIEGISQGYADLLRSDYEDYRTRFEPFEKISQAYFQPDQHRSYDKAAYNYATGGVNSAYKSAQAYQAEMARRTGTRLDSREQASVNRQLGNSRAALLADATNTTRDQLEQRDIGLLQGLVNFGQQDRAQGLQQSGYLANLADNRERNNDAMNNAADQQQQSTISGAIGTGLTMALTGNPVAGVAMAGVSLLGSLF